MLLCLLIYWISPFITDGRVGDFGAEDLGVWGYDPISERVLDLKLRQKRNTIEYKIYFASYRQRNDC